MKPPEQETEPTLETTERKTPKRRVYQMRVSLLEVHPAIWRRFRVSSHLTLHQLHQVVQAVMGWEDYHLYEFTLGHSRPGAAVLARQTYGAGETVNTEMTLDTMIYREEQSFFYIYDFGDYWEHEIVVENILTPRTGVKGLRFPVCLSGSRACPPEDCGGSPGYMELLDTLKRPRSRAYREMKEWLGGRFDPKAFDVKAINRELKALEIR